MKKLLTQREDIFVVPNFLTKEECEQQIAKCEAVGFADAPINGPSGPVISKGMRNNERVIIDDYSTANDLFTRIKEHLPESCSKASGINERFRYYRYEPGQFFDWHFDGSYKTSRLTFMIYLNDDFTGGTTDFNFAINSWSSLPIVQAKPEKGMALVFVHNVLHRGAPVLTGRKYVMRSDIMFNLY
jgi:hypothetical protein